MKRRLLPLLFVVGLISLTSCKKEQTTGLEFTATMEECTDVHNAKTVLNGTALHWAEGDQVRIYGNGWSDFAVTPLSPATNARFTAIEGGSLEQSSTYRAYYPSTLTTDGVTVTLPATQTSADGTLREFPMYAESATQQLLFKNLCGLLKLNLQKSGETISSIRLTMGSPINGTYTVSTTSGGPALNLQSGSGSNTTTLECNQSINEAHDFYIYLPEGTYSGLTLEITATDGTVCTKGPATSNVVIVRSRYSTLTLSGDNDELDFVDPNAGLPEGALPGVFTVNGNGKQVHFSQGALQYHVGTEVWRLAEYQWSFVGNATYGNVYDGEVRSQNTEPIGDYTGWIDFFGWGTGHCPLNRAYNTPNNSSRSAMADWGDNAIVNGGEEPGIWSVLSVDEYDYLVYGRNNCANLYGRGVVHGVNGAILLPDNWEMPSGVSNSTFTPGVSTSGWPNVYSDDDWALMEAAGAVFFATMGNGWTANNAMTRGRYWTSTSLYSGSSFMAKGFYLSANVYSGVYAETNGSSNSNLAYGVRLVYVSNEGN